MAEEERPVKCKIFEFGDSNPKERPEAEKQIIDFLSDKDFVRANQSTSSYNRAYITVFYRDKDS